MSQPGTIVIIPANTAPAVAPAPPPPAPVAVTTLPVQRQQSSGDSALLTGIGVATVAGLIGAGTYYAMSRKPAKTPSDALRTEPATGNFSLNQELAKLDSNTRRKVFENLGSTIQTNDEYHFARRYAHDLFHIDQYPEFHLAASAVEKRAGFTTIDPAAENKHFQSAPAAKQLEKIENEFGTMEKLTGKDVAIELREDRAKMFKLWLSKARDNHVKPENLARYNKCKAVIFKAIR